MKTSDKRLMIVDDDPGVVTLLMRLAKNSGYEALVGIANHDFETLVLNWNPAVIALNIMMPGRDGLELVGGLKRINYLGA